MKTNWVIEHFRGMWNIVKEQVTQDAKNSGLSIPTILQMYYKSETISKQDLTGLLAIMLETANETEKQEILAVGKPFFVALRENVRKNAN
jgi:hypothetical protein